MATTRVSGDQPSRAEGGGSLRGDRSGARILDAAVAELVESGGVLEVAAVARRAAVSIGLPYRYFGTRSGLLVAVVESFYDRLDAAVLHRVFPGQTWQEREHRRTAAWVEFLFREPLAPIVLGRLPRDAGVAEVELNRLERAIESGARNIAYGQAASDLPSGRDPHLLAAAVLGGMRTSVAFALMWTSRPSRRRITEELWAFVLGSVTGAAPPPRRTTTARAPRKALPRPGKSG